MHLTIGLTGVFGVGGVLYLPPSWRIIYDYVPGGSFLYPNLFVLTGAVAAVGIRSPCALKLGFQLSAGLFLIWALAGIPSWLLGTGSNLQGIGANLFIAGCALVLSYYVTVGLRSEAVNVQVEKLAEQIYQAGEANGPDLT